MKKNYLKFIALIAIISMSSTKLFAQFPEWSYSNVGTDSVRWEGVNWGMMDPDWADDFMADGKVTLDLDYYTDFDMDTEGVSDVWDKIVTDAYPVNKYLVTEDGAKRAPDNAEDFSAEIKGFFDNDNVYILVKVTDNEIIPGMEALELMWASYPDYLPKEDWPFTPRATEDNEHTIAYWGNRGAGKALANLDFYDNDTIPIGLESGFYFSQVSGTTSDAYWTHSWTTPDWDKDLGMKVGQFKQTGNTTWEAIWKLDIEKSFGGYVTAAKDVEFSFDFKIIDNDTLTQPGTKIEALFSSTNNEVWWSTYYAGRARFTQDPVSVASNVTASNISVYPNPTTDELFISQEVAKIEVFNVLGAKVTEVNKMARKVSLAGLKKGIYIVNTTDTNNKVSSFKVVVE
jgi:hypothetical protein